MRHETTVVAVEPILDDSREDRAFFDKQNALHPMFNNSQRLRFGRAAPNMVSKIASLITIGNDYRPSEKTVSSLVSHDVKPSALSHPT
jgi:hypothetical protein